MSRKPRLISGSGIYHVMLRGVNRKAIFLCDADNRKFIDVLSRAKKQSDFKLFAYCLMINHVHLLIKEEDEPLATIMKRIGVSYASYFNKKYECVGHLLQGRFRSEPVESDPYFHSVIRYICQNPVKAGMVQMPVEYPWLGCSGLTENDLLDSLDQFSGLSPSEITAFVSEVPSWRHLEDEGKMGDEEAAALICETCSCLNPGDIAEWGQKNRNAAILQASAAGVPVVQIVRLTGVSKATVMRVMQELSPRSQVETKRTVPEVSG